MNVSILSGSYCLVGLGSTEGRGGGGGARV